MEIEAKFYLADLTEVRRRLALLGGVLVQEAHLERNWRFDRVDGSLRAEGKVLRLRITDHASLAVKDPGDLPEIRGEIEVEVADPSAARSLLAALGYHPFFAYEKRRETHRIEQALVMLDELPFGTFVEIEAESLQAVEAASRRLGIDWSRRVGSSYLGLFARLHASRRLTFEDATFAAFSGQAPVQAEELGVQDALSNEFDERRIR